MHRKKRKKEKRKKNKPSFFSDNPSSNLSKCINTGALCQIETGKCTSEKLVGTLTSISCNDQRTSNGDKMGQMC